MTVDEAASVLRAGGVTVHSLAVGVEKDPHSVFGVPRSLPFDPTEVEAAARGTGGQTYRAGDRDTLRAALKAVANSLEPLH
jgi:hypothetical protein